MTEEPGKEIRLTEKDWNRIVHDLSKPRSTVKMFLDLLPRLLNQPDELSKWRDVIQSSFDESQKTIAEVSRALEK